MPIIYGILAPNYAVLNIYGFLAKAGVAVFVFLTGYGTAKSVKEKGRIGAVSNTEQRSACGQKTLLREVSTEGGFAEQYNISVMASAAMSRYVKLLLSFQFVFIIFIIPGLVKGSLNNIYNGGSLLINLFYCGIDFLGLANVAATATYNGTWWYMSLALMLIAILPFVIYACRRYGFLMLILVFFMTRYLLTDFTFAWYMFSAVAGVFMAQRECYEKLKDSFNTMAIWKKITVIALLLFGLGVLLELRLFIKAELWDVIEAALAILFCALSCLTISKVPVLGTILEFVGRHSMNMFLTHTFIYYFWFRNHIYSFKYPALMLLVLIVETVSISVVLEQIKKWIRFDRFTSFVCKKVNNLVCKDA